MKIRLDGANGKPRACDSFLRVWREQVGDESADIEWNEAAQGWVLADPFWRQGMGWAWAEGIAPMWSMRKANLRKADLRGANLSGANLYRANLSGVIRNEYTHWPDGFNLKERDER